MIGGDQPEAKVSASTRGPWAPTLPCSPLRCKRISRARCFWIEAAEGHGATAISCRKSEIGLSLPRDQSCASAWPRPQAPVPALRTQGEGLRKKFPRFMPRNSLKRLDSDERIQGNPTRLSAAFGAKRPLAKKTQMGATGQRRGLCREGAKPTPSTAPAVCPTRPSEPGQLQDVSVEVVVVRNRRY